MRGWLKIPGIQEGARTLAEQLLGLEPALAEAKGKTILDLGCAEGLIARQFILAGAVSALGIDSNEQFISVARQQCKGMNIRFHLSDLGRAYIPAQKEIQQFDIVLALSIAHKITDPSVLVRFAARSAKDLVCFRGPGSETLRGENGTIIAKHGHPDHGRLACNVPEVMQSEGFVLERTINGVRGESVEYWRRSSA